jgi:hypothetical protein
MYAVNALVKNSPALAEKIAHIKKYHKLLESFSPSSPFLHLPSFTLE